MSLSPANGAVHGQPAPPVSDKTAVEYPAAPFIPLRNIIGSPTPIALVGLVMSLTPLSTNLMGWRSQVNSGGAEIAAYFFFGGVLMLVSGFVELILRNTFQSIVFMSFGAFFLFYGGTLQPFFAASSTYGGAETLGFSAALAYMFLFMAVLCLFFLICGLRTNFAFEWIFFTVMVALTLVTAALWMVAKGKAETARQCAKAAGAFFFACSMGGWYTLLALMLPTVDFPILLPLGDLSSVIPGRTQKPNVVQKSREGDIPSSA